MAFGIGAVLATAGIAVALAGTGIASAIGLKNGGVAAAGAVAEKGQDAFVNSMTLQALPMTQTIYGFITALLIAIGAGFLPVGAPQEPTLYTGLIMLGVGCFVALTGLSAVYQGMVSAAGISAAAKRSDALVPSLVFGGQVEVPAIFGFIVALIVLFVGLAVLG